MAKVSHADTLTQKAIISYPPAGRVLKHLEEMYKRHPGIKLRPEDASQVDYFLLDTAGYFKFKMEYDDPVWATVQPGMLADCWTQEGPNNRDELIGASFHYAQLWIKFRNREKRFIDDETLHVMGAMFKSISKISMNTRCNDLYGKSKMIFLTRYWKGNPMQLMKQYLVTMDKLFPYWRDDLDSGSKENLQAKSWVDVIYFCEHCKEENK